MSHDYHIIQLPHYNIAIYVRAMSSSWFSSREIDLALTFASKEAGCSELHPKQKMAIGHFSRGSYMFVALPTGSGKSLCYCLLPRVFDILLERTGSIVVVISPLIALMQDKVRAMTERNITAVYAGSTDENLEWVICSGAFQLVFCSPEAILRETCWREMLRSPVYSEKLVAFIVDEAHCVKAR